MNQHVEAARRLGTCRAARIGICLFVRFLVVVALTGRELAFAQFSIQQDPPATAEFPPPPREQRQLLSRAQRAIDDREYSVAVEMLFGLLQQPDSEDFFLEAEGKPVIHQSVKRRAQEILGSMPAAGREILELKLGKDARRDLDQAIQAADIDAVRQVARRYFHTQAGYQATYLLARYELDRHRALAATLYLKRLREAGGGSGFEPELSLLYAVSLRNSGQSDAARQMLEELKLRQPRIEWRIAEQRVELPSDDTDLVTWLDKIYPDIAGEPGVAVADWRTTGGNPQRNGVVDGGVPLPDEEHWTDTIIFDEDRRQLERFQSDQRTPMINSLPSLQPLAIGDWLLMRTPTLTFGVDLPSGRMVWAMPWERVSDLRPTPRDDASAAAYFLKKQTWDDLTYGQMSSNGRALYAVTNSESDGPSEMFNIRQLQLQAMMGGMESQRDTYNNLIAVDIANEGKNLWMLGGPTSDDPALQDAYFLGPPLALDDELYVIAELKDEIKLLALDARDGKLLWAQQLAQVELPLAYDPDRQSRGCVPSYADGILVCPTGAGVLVAVDLANRSLLWGYAYRSELQTARSTLPRRGLNWTGSTHGWSDNLAVLAGGRVVITPITSNRLHCLDLLTGEELWRPKPRSDGMFVAGVARDQIIVVTSHGVEAVEMNSGSVTWQFGLPERVSPSGRGFVTQDSVFFPTDDAAIVRVSLDDGQLVERVATKHVLGNLICHKNYLISQAPEAVRVFRLRDRTRVTVLQQLAVNPDDVHALRDQVAILTSDGKPTEALQVLDHLISLETDDASLEERRRQKVQLVLNLLEADYDTHAAYAQQIETFTMEPADRLRLNELQADSMFRRGDVVGAFERYLELIDALARLPVPSNGDDPRRMIEVERGTWSVARPRWFATQLREILENAQPAQQTAMVRNVSARLETLLASHDWDSAEELIRYLPDVDVVMDTKLKISRRLMTEGKLLAAEILLSDCRRSPSHRGPALAIQALLMSRYGTPVEAKPIFDELLADFRGVRVLDGLTPRDLLETISGRRPSPRDLLPDGQWPTGKVEVVADARQPEQFSRQVRRIPMLESREQWPDAWTVRVDLDPRARELSVSDGNGNPVVRVPVEPGYLFNVNTIPTAASAYQHLLVVSVGNSLLAIDTLSEVQSGADRLLWHAGEQQSRFSFGYVTPQATSFNAQKSVAIPVFNGESLLRASIAGRFAGQVGPVTQFGVCYLDKDDLVCADLLTGQPVWVRKNVGDHCELFGDDEYVFACPMDSRQARVFSARTGQLLGEREIPFPDRRWKKIGRYVLTWESVAVLRTPANFRLFDCWEGKDVWTRELDPQARGCLVGNDQIAVLHPDGLFEVWSIQDGKVIFSTRLPEEKQPASIHVIRSSDQYLLIVNQRNNIQLARRLPGMNLSAPAVDSTQCPLISGRMYVFDGQSGAPLWAEPLEVNDYFLPPHQPADLPTLVLMRTFIQTRNLQRRGAQSSIVCIDKRTGDLLFADHAIRRPLETFFVHGDLERKAITIQTGSDPAEAYSVVTLQFSDQPRPKSVGDPFPGLPNAEEEPEKTGASDREKAMEDVLGERLKER